MDTWGAPSPGIFFLKGLLFVIPVAFLIPSSHPNITANTNTTTLFGHGPAQVCAFSKSWKLLGTEDGELI
jgi:hypothetical protein